VPLVAAIRLPLTLVLGFLIVLVLDALMLLAADSLTDGDLHVDGFWSALLVALVASAVTLVLQVVAGIDDDSEWSYRVVQRIARKTGDVSETDAPGIIFLEIDGLAHDVLRRAMRDGNAPTLARWVREGSHRFVRWETDWSSQTGACQAGLLHGNNHDMPAFRWWEKDRGTAIVTNHPRDAEELERRLVARDRAEWQERFDEAGVLPVINATGVIVHTNLGRAPLAADEFLSLQAVQLLFEQKGLTPLERP